MSDDRKVIYDGPLGALLSEDHPEFIPWEEAEKMGAKVNPDTIKTFSRTWGRRIREDWQHSLKEFVRGFLKTGIPLAVVLAVAWWMRHG